ncbi:hypothetical protein PHMEG_00021853 [Phytophthora megakarya]|uniref:Uncharacterized protein n=1 Tax=Phytophthora megakarya TaxID=4795 RepID=A0A225VKL7_9STRA|nr:hypothetical protein PHMEG_00021853 [Phytophthora megakarya]
MHAKELAIEKVINSSKFNLVILRLNCSCDVISLPFAVEQDKVRRRLQTQTKQHPLFERRRKYNLCKVFIVVRSTEIARHGGTPFCQLGFCATIFKTEKT